MNSEIRYIGITKFIWVLGELLFLLHILFDGGFYVRNFPKIKLLAVLFVP